MHEPLYKYLVLNQHLSIPQLGTFQIKQQPAYVNEGAGTLHPPIPVIDFTKEESTETDPELISFLTRELNVDESNVRQQLGTFSDKLNQDLTSNQWFVFPGLGKLEKENGNWKITVVNHLDELLPVLQPGPHIHLGNMHSHHEPVIAEEAETESSINESEEDEEEMETPKDHWKVFALLLAIAAAIALYLHKQ